MPLLALLVPVIAWVLRSAVVGMVVRAIAGLGLGLATYKMAVAPFVDYVRSGAAGVDPSVAQWAGIMKLDIAVTIILSACVVRAAVSAVHFIKK